ncbi:MAG: M23 family metallopeptidase [Spirochaetaceae bacterium]|jgi:murein DD-endopeptidase MepM/ murein hydrolase activator NlpD|nr:M23 family metallopeptidase [Spirochaetaceae bacterium]
MAKVHGYKRFEDSLVRKIRKGFLSCGKTILSLIQGFWTAITRTVTITMVPHSEKKVHQFRLSFLSVFFVCLFFVAILGAFAWFGISYTEIQGTMAIKDNRLQNTQANLDELRGEISSLLRQSKNFQAVMSETLSSMGINLNTEGGAENSNSGDLASFFNIQDTGSGSLQESSELQGFTNYLASVQEPVKEMGSLLSSQSTLLTEIPNIWPIKGGIGHISMSFGQNENPFTHQYYIHKGIDLSTYRQGDSVLATADGQIVSINNDPGGFGINIVIKHKHGFYTRYAHLQATVRVRVGQRVQQGSVIGYIGNTGLTTGPHLHYEVHIGADVVDPYKYLNIKTNNTTLARN